MRNFVIVIGLWLTLLSGAAAAQDPVWVQVEAQPTLREGQARAVAYASAFDNVAGFRMVSGWYAIVLGPYTDAGAAARLSELRSENLIPRDSFIARGNNFRAPFFPAGTDPAAAPPVDEIAALTPILPDPGAPILDLNDNAALTGAPPSADAGQDSALPYSQPDETQEEARASEAALDKDARMDLQSALKSFGFYTSAIDGAIGPGTRDAMAAWQAANGYFPSGILTSAERTAMLGERARIAAELDLQTVTENEAGIEIQLPMALLQFQDYQPPFVHYAEKDDSGVRALLISQPGSAAALSGLYDTIQTLEAMPRSGPRGLDGNAFTIDGTNATTGAYAQAELKNGLIKGFMLIWDPTRPDKAKRALVAMKQSFRPIGTRALDPGLVALSDTQRRSLMAGMEVRRPALSRSGFFVDDGGAVLTTSDVLQDCRRITLDRAYEARVDFTDTGLGIALLKPLTRLAPPAVAQMAGAARIGEPVAIAGYSYEAALPAATLTSGAVEDIKGLDGSAGVNRLSIDVLPGDAGGPVLDSAGGVLGMLLAPETGSARTLPPGVSFLATGAQIGARLAQAGIKMQSAAASPPLTPDSIAARGADLTVLVSCWK